MLVLLLLGIVVFSQATAVVRHEQHESSGHYCLLCHAGPLPLLQTSILVPRATAIPVGWVAFNPDSGSPFDALLPATSSRAPPAA